MGCNLSYPVLGQPMKAKHEPFTAVNNQLQFVKLPEYDNAEMSYTYEGPGWAALQAAPVDTPIVLLVHGITYYQFSMAPAAKFFASKGCHTLRMDLFGRGASDLPAAEHTTDFYTGQLASFLKALGVNAARPLIVIGHSMGGAITVAFAARFPERIRGVVLLAPAGFVESKAMDCFRCCNCCGACVFGCIGYWQMRNSPLNVSDPNDAERAKALTTTVRTSQALAIDNNPGLRTAFLLSVLHFPFGTLQPEITTVGKATTYPVQLLWGELDGSDNTGVHYNGNKPYRELIPRAQFTSYPKIHHNLLLEYPELLHRDIWTFIEALVTAPAAAAAGGAAAGAAAAGSAAAPAPAAASAAAPPVTPVAVRDVKIDV